VSKHIFSILMAFLCLGAAACGGESAGGAKDAGALDAARPAGDADPLAPDAAPAPTADAMPGAPDAALPFDFVGTFAIGKAYTGTCSMGDANLSFNRFQVDPVDPMTDQHPVTTWHATNPMVPVRTTTATDTARGVLHVERIVLFSDSSGSEYLEAFDATGPDGGDTWSAQLHVVFVGMIPCTESWDVTGSRL
jgi:hypothetical protein